MIDIDIVVDSVSQLNKIIPHLVGLGYQYLGEVAVPDRFVFRPPSKAVPNDGAGRLWLKHHLYCCIKGSAALRNHLLLRYALRKDESLINAYASLKRTLAETANNIDGYVMGKTSFYNKNPCRTRYVK
ncbi:GrpB family protein [Pedobacter kyonggii]|uniref:GrpB family protein n=1 Tax=Pedobacter kyonggii TaxID=1926871 RepID=A0A4Q9H3S1_9SPHI|nr:GrpB family protein [Pedobacter kyonggii]